MFYYGHQRHALAYLIWRSILKKCGAFTSELDAQFFGPSRGMNDYGELAPSYKKSSVKPDKQYSILPTVLDLAKNCKDKLVVDIGCGTGFFTLPFVKLGVRRVFAIDNSVAQLDQAYETARHPLVTYLLRDVFVDRLPQGDIMIAPFVSNYARTVPILEHFFRQIYNALYVNGKLVLVVDLPNSKNLKRFGAVKTIGGTALDEAEIQIELYSKEKKICTLMAVYYTPKTIEDLLRKIGFKRITWHKPVISEEGIEAMGKEFWKGYIEDPELGYLTAEK